MKEEWLDILKRALGILRVKGGLRSLRKIRGSTGTKKSTMIRISIYQRTFLRTDETEKTMDD